MDWNWKLAIIFLTCILFLVFISSVHIDNEDYKFEKVNSGNLEYYLESPEYLQYNDSNNGSLGNRGISMNINSVSSNSVNLTLEVSGIASSCGRDEIIVKNLNYDKELLVLSTSIESKRTSNSNLCGTARELKIRQNLLIKNVDLLDDIESIEWDHVNKFDKMYRKSVEIK